MKNPASIISVKRLLTGLAVLCTTLASPLDFLSISNTKNAANPISNTLTFRSSDMQWISLGCLTDNRNLRTLRTHVPFRDMDLTVKSCQAACLGKVMAYAGLTFGSQCWCDSAIQTEIITANLWCSYSCSGNSNEICGGEYFINIYSYSSTTSTSGFSTTAATLVTPTTPTNTLSATAYATDAFTSNATLKPAGPSSTSTCLIYYRVVKGNYCYDIWTRFRISQEQLESYNPSLTWPNCQIQPGQFLCVEQGPAANAVVRTVTAMPDPPTSLDNVAISTTLATTWLNTTTMQATLIDTSTSKGTQSIFIPVVTTTVPAITPIVTSYTVVYVETATAAHSAANQIAGTTSAVHHEPCNVVRACACGQT